MDINSILGTALGFATASVLTPILLAAYKAFKVKEKIQEGITGILELSGKSAAKKIKLIKDPAIRDQMYKDVRESADKFDEAFNKGLDEEMAK